MFHSLSQTSLWQENTLTYRPYNSTFIGKANLEDLCSIPVACQTVFFLLNKVIQSSSLTYLENILLYKIT